MAEQAQITSLEAIESFRASLVLFLNKARSTLGEVSNEVIGTRLWLQNDQRRYWENQMRLRGRKLEEAQQELFSAKLSRLQDATALQQMAVQRAQRAVREAEARLARLKKWDRELDDRSAPLVKQVDQLQSFLTTEMGKAIAHLAQVVTAVEAYTGVVPPGADGPGAGGGEQS
jgi:hypothetical protein